MPRKKPPLRIKGKTRNINDKLNDAYSEMKAKKAKGKCDCGGKGCSECDCG